MKQTLRSLKNACGNSQRTWKQVRHHQVPVNLLSQPLILPSPFLTTISMNLDWIQSPVATRWTHPTPRSPSPYNFLSSLLFIWCPTPPVIRGNQDPASMLKLMRMAIPWSALAENTLTVPLGKAAKEFVFEVCILLRAYADGKALESIA